MEGDVDLIGANQDLDAASVTGFYSDKTERMVVRGTDITDAVTRVTVVHELTHALQDQHFDLHELRGLARCEGRRGRRQLFELSTQRRPTADC